MRRLYVWFAAVILLVSVAVIPVCAYETDTVAVDETVLSEETETGEVSDSYAEQFFDYVMGSDEMIDRFIAMGDQYRAAKEEGYTFKERILQLLTPENLIVTVAAAFMIACGVALFLFRRSFNKNSGIANAAILSLKKQFSEERSENKLLRETVEKQNETIKALSEKLDTVTGAAENAKKGVERVGNVSMAVATMIKDVFMNSRTIDSSGKNLLLHEFNEALNCLESLSDKDGATEQTESEDK